MITAETIECTLQATMFFASANSNCAASTTNGPTGWDVGGCPYVLCQAIFSSGTS